MEAEKIAGIRGVNRERRNNIQVVYIVLLLRYFARNSEIALEESEDFGKFSFFWLVPLLIVEKEEDHLDCFEVRDELLFIFFERFRLSDSSSVDSPSPSSSTETSPSWLLY